MNISSSSAVLRMYRFSLCDFPCFFLFRLRYCFGAECYAACVIKREYMVHVFGFMAELAFIGFLEKGVLLVSGGPLVRCEFEYWEESCDVECVDCFGC
jgi:hypothetical protein